MSLSNMSVVKLNCIPRCGTTMSKICWITNDSHVNFIATNKQTEMNVHIGTQMSVHIFAFIGPCLS